MIAARRVAHPIILPPPMAGVCEIQDHQRTALEADARVKFPQWGRGGGKSIYGICEHLSQTFKHPRDVGFIVAQTGPMLEDYRLGKLEPFLAWFEQLNGFRVERRFVRTPRPRYELITGGQWWLIPSDNPDKLRGPDFGYGLIEEAAICLNQQALWTAILPTFRARPDFVLALPTTPRPESFLVQHCLERVRAGDPTYWTSKAPSYVNRCLEPAFWELMRRELTPEMFRQEIEAEMLTVEGAVYGQAFRADTYPDGNIITFDPNRTVARSRANFALVGAVDWGTRATTFLAIVRDLVSDIDIIADEMCLDGMSIEQATEHIAKRVREYPSRWCGLEMNIVYTDPTGRDWNAALRKKLPATCRVAYTWHPVLRDLATGIEIVQRRLLSADGRRRLYVAKDVVALPQSAPGGRGIYQVLTGTYRYSKVIKYGHFRPEPEKDGKNDHAADTLRYGMINLYYTTIYGALD